MTKVNSVFFGILYGTISMVYLLSYPALFLSLLMIKPATPVTISAAVLILTHVMTIGIGKRIKQLENKPRSRKRAKVSRSK